MRFASPLALLALLPAAAIVALYMLRLRRRDVVVSSVFLWRQAIRDVQANAPFQKLRRNLLLYLQLATVAVLALALARPLLIGRGLGGRSIVLVMDASASMEATDVAPNRLEAARREALRLVDDLKPQDQVLVLVAGARPEAVTGFTSDRNALRRALIAVAPRETGVRMREALQLAAALVASRDASEIDLFSDGGFAPVSGLRFGKARLVFHRVGREGGNVAITGVDSRRSLAGDGAVQVFATLRNFDRLPRTFTVEVLRGDDLIDAHEVTLPAGGEAPEIFDLPQPATPTPLTVRLDVKDALAVDNRADLVLAPRRPIRALVVGPGNRYLETALRVDPDVELDRVDLSGFRGPAGYDAVIFDGAAPKTLPEGRYLFLDCADARAPVTPGAENADQGIVDFARDHPVMRYVDFGRTRWTTMRSGTPAPWAREIASADAGPAIVAGERGRLRALWFGFRLDPQTGAFPLTAACPILFSNALRWLAGTDTDATVALRTGDPLTLDGLPAGARITVAGPDGKAGEAVAGPSGSVAYDRTELPGLYTVAGPNGYRRIFAANLADEAESDLVPRAHPDLDTGPAGPAGRPVSVARDLRPWLIAGLLALLAFEWWVFHRRFHID